LIYFRF